MKKNAFTLVELLAVIVILGITMAIASASLMKAKMETNKKEAEQIKESIKDLGMEIYSYEMSSLGSDEDDYFKKVYTSNDNDVYVTFEELYKAGYLKNIVTDDSGNFSGIKNPAGGAACTGYLHIKDAEFKSCLSCEGIEEFTDSCSIGRTASLTN